MDKGNFSECLPLSSNQTNIRNGIAMSVNEESYGDSKSIPPNTLIDNYQSRLQTPLGSANYIDRN